MARYFFILLCCCCTTLSWAQDPMTIYQTRYTWVEDQDFTKPADFFGYTFVPSEGKMSIAHYPDPFDVGVVSFEVSRSSVLINERANYTPAGIVDPPLDVEPYRLRISRIVDKQDYGVEFYLVDHTNRELEGYLKFYRDPIGQVEMIKYRPSMADPEHVYWLPNITEEQALEDGKFFTHQEDFDSRTLDELWGKVLYPFLSYENQSDLNNRKITRIYPRDEIDIRFEEEVVNKGKKEKLMQYIIFNPKDGNRRKLLVKKVYEVEGYQDREDNKPRTILEVEVRDEAKQEDYFVLFHRGLHKGKQRLLRAVELQDAKTRRSLLYYEMRRGEGIIVEEPPQSAANEVKTTVD
jgi:hypothetical protein